MAAGPALFNIATLVVRPRRVEALGPGGRAAGGQSGLSANKSIRINQRAGQAKAGCERRRASTRWHLRKLVAAELACAQLHKPWCALAAIVWLMNGTFVLVAGARAFRRSGHVTTFDELAKESASDEGRPGHGQRSGRMERETKSGSFQGAHENNLIPFHLASCGLASGGVAPWPLEDDLVERALDWRPRAPLTTREFIIMLIHLGFIDATCAPTARIVVQLFRLASPMRRLAAPV